MNMPCAVSGLKYATLPLLMAPIEVLNIRFIGTHSDQTSFPQVGQLTPPLSSIEEISLADMLTTSFVRPSSS